MENYVCISYLKIAITNFDMSYFIISHTIQMLCNGKKLNIKECYDYAVQNKVKFTLFENWMCFLFLNDSSTWSEYMNLCIRCCGISIDVLSTLSM